MNQYRKPHRLQKGDTVGIVSPSSTIAPFPRRLQRGIEALEAIGLRVILAPHCQGAFGHNGGTAQERADDINTFFANPNIQGIVCSTGGYTANAVLPLLDYELIRSNPKIFCGYSDITALNLAITYKAKIVTFNGPTVLPVFGDFGGPHAFTVRNFEKALFSNQPIGILENADTTSEENLWWDKDDTRPRAATPAEPPKALHPGSAEGVLLGGNLETLTFLGGTEFMPDFTDSILFLEEMGEGTDVIERDMDHLQQLGILGKIKGLIFGRPYDLSTVSTDRTLDDILQGIGEHFQIPVLTNVDCGHCVPMLTMPLGIRTKLDADTLTVTITEPATV